MVLVLALTAPSALYAVVIDDAITPSGVFTSVTDGNITISFNEGSGNLESVVVDGVNQLASIQWFYRVNNDTQEFALNGFGGSSQITSVNVVDNAIEVVGTTNSFDFTFTYAPIDPIGFGTVSAFLDITLDIGALSGGSDAVSIFAIFDYDLDQDSENDSIFGDLNQFTQSSEFTTAITQPEDLVFGEGFVNPAGLGDVSPSNFEVAIFPNLTFGLTDNSLTTFADSNSTLDDTDVTFGYQWNFTIGSTGSNAQIDVHTEFNVVPEPSTYAMLLLGIGSLLLFGRVGPR